jgi:hypothetical protein
MLERQRYAFRARDHGSVLSDSNSREARQRVHQTKNARIVPPKSSNASPHKEKFIALAVASFSIPPLCAL